VELQHVEMIGFHASKALLDTGDDVLGGEHMGATLPARSRRRANQTTALAGKVVTVATMRDVAADAFLAQPVIDRRVDIVDPGIKDGIENCIRLVVGDVASTRDTTQLHCAVAEHRHLQPRSSKFALG